jgi:hypothetical protein
MCIKKNANGALNIIIFYAFNEKTHQEKGNACFHS